MSKARFLFSQNHTIAPYTAAISAVFASLVTPLPSYSDEQIGREFEPVKYSSKTNWSGSPFVAGETVDVWKDNKEAGIILVKQMDQLYDELVRKSTSNSSDKS